jgi:hypothetical protein
VKYELERISSFLEWNWERLKSRIGRREVSEIGLVEECRALSPVIFKVNIRYNSLVSI